jgi:cyclophilin family peptidyl-prolyl cis-trans isomerase
MRRLLLACLFAAMAAVPAGAQRGPARPATPGDPIMVIETVKGTIEIELFQKDAPKSVAHIVALIKRSFYRGQRFHRVERGLVQFGDPGTRSMRTQASWGTGNSGNPIGVAEFSSHKHIRGAVGLAHGGDPKFADSQLYIMKVADPGLDGKHVVVGQVISGMPVVDRIERADMLKNVTLR